MFVCVCLFLSQCTQQCFYLLLCLSSCIRVFLSVSLPFAVSVATVGLCVFVSFMSVRGAQEECSRVRAQPQRYPGCLSPKGPTRQRVRFSVCVCLSMCLSVCLSMCAAVRSCSCFFGLRVCVPFCPYLSVYVSSVCLACTRVTNLHLKMGNNRWEQGITRRAS